MPMPPMNAPDFWRDGRGPWPRLLYPFSCLYALGGRLRQMTGRPASPGVPVICIGNLTAGGAGKTPVAIAVARYLRAAGRTPHFLCHGYGGRLEGPMPVDGRVHGANEVGDEARLLAREAPAWIARDRVAGAREAVGAGADVVVMDDGFQDPALAKTVSLLVFDGHTGLGNGLVIPAGPLRESLGDGLARADAAVVMGDDASGMAALLRARAPALSVLRAHLAPTAEAARLKGVRVFGFAGIGLPEKFRTTLTEIGAVVAGFRAFADHHPYTARDVAGLRRSAAAAGARLVTTAKDAMRLSEAMLAEIEVVEVEAVFEDGAALARALGLSAASAAPAAPGRGA